MTLEGSSPDIIELAYTWPLCFEFKLKPRDVVIVAGAYKGKVMELLLDLYPGIIVHGFEPQQWAAKEATERLFKNHPTKKWSISEFGIGEFNSTEVKMGEWGTDACSFVNTGPDSRDAGVGDILEFGEVMTNMLGIDHIDLAIFNMEGYEFLLLPHLMRTRWLEKIDRLAVQWHVNLGAGDKADVDALVKKISKLDYRLVYDHRPQWTYHECSSI